MEVILLERVNKLGQMGETVKVRDGYARNYLLQLGKARSDPLHGFRLGGQLVAALDRQDEGSFGTRRLRLDPAKIQQGFEGRIDNTRARHIGAARNLERKSEAQKIADKLEGKTFVMVRSAGETGQLYGSVAARDIVEALAEEGFNIGRNQIDLNTPIKMIGLHKVTLHLHSEVEIEIELNVARSADEAARQAKGESLTSADAIYGVDEDALKPEDFFDASQLDHDEEL